MCGTKLYFTTIPRNGARSIIIAIIQPIHLHFSTYMSRSLVTYVLRAARNTRAEEVRVTARFPSTSSPQQTNVVPSSLCSQHNPRNRPTAEEHTEKTISNTDSYVVTQTARALACNHGANALIRQQFHEDRVLGPPVDDMRGLDALRQASDAALDLRRERRKMRSSVEGQEGCKRSSQQATITSSWLQIKTSTRHSQTTLGSQL